MSSEWAAENLQVIRTLMERSAVYRRALAPVMILVGFLGTAGAVIPCFRPIDRNQAFALFWMVIGFVSLSAALFMVRRQALQASESLWSPPTRRVTQAVLPAFLVGFTAGVSLACPVFPLANAGWLLTPVWMVCYGVALHAAAFFMQRGVRLFGWLFVVAGCGVALCSLLGGSWAEARLRHPAAGHYIMGLFFGLGHLAFGVYLYFTEKKNEA